MSGINPDLVCTCVAGLVAPHEKIPHRRAGYQIEKIDGKEGLGSGDGHLWRALSRRHDHRFGKILLHLKGLNAALAAEPLTRNRGVQRKLELDNKASTWPPLCEGAHPAVSTSGGPAPL